MRISDWSSDVCSSDLVGEVGIAALPLVGAPGEGLGAPVVGQVVVAAVPAPFLRPSFQQPANDVLRVELVHVDGLLQADRLPLAGPVEGVGDQGESAALGAPQLVPRLLFGADQS